VLDITARRVQQLADDGVLPRAGRGKYLLIPCVQGYIKYWRDRAEGRGVEAGDGALYKARTRKTQAEALLAELDLAEAEGRLIPLDMHEDLVRKLCELLAAKCKSLGQYIGDVQLATTDVDAAALLERITDELLRAFMRAADEIEA
jgi:hypothetical protein